MIMSYCPGAMENIESVLDTGFRRVEYEEAVRIAVYSDVASVYNGYDSKFTLRSGDCFILDGSFSIPEEPSSTIEIEWAKYESREDAEEAALGEDRYDKEPAMLYRGDGLLAYIPSTQYISFIIGTAMVNGKRQGAFLEYDNPLVGSVLGFILKKYGMRELGFIDVREKMILETLGRLQKL